MSLYKPFFFNEEDDFIIGKLGPSKLTSAIIRQFAVCLYVERRLSLLDKIIFLN